MLSYWYDLRKAYVLFNAL